MSRKLPEDFHDETPLKKQKCAVEDQLINNLRGEVDMLTAKLAEKEKLINDIKDELRCHVCYVNRTDQKTVCGDGHTLCGTCLNAIEEIAGKKPTAYERRTSRKCPLCRNMLIAGGFKNRPMFNVLELINKHDGTLDNITGYTTPNEEGKHVQALQLSCYASGEIAKCAYNSIMREVPQPYFDKGFVIKFHAAITRAFFERMAILLNDLNIVYINERSLSIFVVDRKSKPVDALPDTKSVSGIGTPRLLLLTVTTDGKYDAFTANTNVCFPHSGPNQTNIVVPMLNFGVTFTQIYKEPYEDGNMMFPVRLINNTDPFITASSLGFEFPK